MSDDQRARIRCMGPYPHCGHSEGECTAQPEYQAMISANRPFTRLPEGMAHRPVDYTGMDGSTLLKALGDDADKWASAFAQANPSAGLDHGRSRLIHSDKAWSCFKSEVDRQRAFLASLRNRASP